MGFFLMGLRCQIQSVISSTAWDFRYDLSLVYSECTIFVYEKLVHRHMDIRQVNEYLKM